MVRILIGVLSVCLFFLFQAQGIPAGDSGDLVTAAATFGVPHPPGYPLYTFAGWILSHIPVFTVSWRVGLLSSLPHAMVIVFVYMIVFGLTRKVAAGLFAALLLLGNYVFFLYSITPEVFALLDLFVVVLFWLALRWQETKRIQLLYLLCFTIGLSLTHHHVVVFILPALLYFLWQKKRSRPDFSYTKAVWSFSAGLLPYLYVWFAAQGHSMVIWDRATNFANVIRLFTRADYGTFQSGAFFGIAPVQRLLEIQAYVQYINNDFTLVGILFILLGLYSLWRTKRQIFWLFVLSVMGIGPVFLFYASFPLMSRFSLGTYERFLLPSYVLFSILTGVGFAFTIHGVAYLVRHMKLRMFMVAGLVCIIFLYPIVTGSATMWKFSGYSGDLTAENLATDVLSGLPYGAVFVLDRDTMLFTTQYVRYVKKFRKDLVVLHNNRLGDIDYQQVVRQNFPSLPMPPHSATFLEQFMKLNAKTNRVFSLAKFSIGPQWYWVPYGFAYELVTKENLPAVAAMTEANIRFWQNAHDPNSGILGRYNHLMLSDVRDVYTTARVEFGKTILKAGDIETAKKQFASAIAYGGETQLAESYTYLGLSELFLNHCDEAIANFEKSKLVPLSNDPNIALYEARTYSDCMGDKKKGTALYDEFVRSQEAGKTPLKKL